MSKERLNLSDLKAKSPADLLAMAEEWEIENASTMRKGEMMFSILKEHAEEGVEIGGDGVLECGLLDWGMVRQTNLAWGLWGGQSAADRPMLEAHVDHLLRLFAREYANQGGPQVDLARLGLHYDLSVMLIGLALMADAPLIVEARAPRAAEAAGLLDPLIVQDQVAHGFLHVFGNFLNLWERRDFGRSLARMLECCG